MEGHRGGFSWIGKWPLEIDTVCSWLKEVAHVIMCIHNKFSVPLIIDGDWLPGATILFEVFILEDTVWCHCDTTGSYGVMFAVTEEKRMSSWFAHVIGMIV